MKPEEIKVTIKLPYIGSITGTWKPDEKQKKAAWELYVELSTRIAVVYLKDDDGFLREALTSLYSLFGISREILKKYGPAVAKSNNGDLSFGHITVRILNDVIRPFLSKWHPKLSDYEEKRDPKISRLEHEKKWERNQEFRKELKSVSECLYEYSKLLATVSGIPLLYAKKNDENSH